MVYSWAATSSQPSKQEKIHICPSSFAFSLSLLIFSLLQHPLTAPRTPDEGWDTDYHGNQSTPSLFSPISHQLYLLTIAKVTLYHPAMVFPTPCWSHQPHPTPISLTILLHQQSQHSRWDIPVQAKGTHTLLAYSS